MNTYETPTLRAIAHACDLAMDAASEAEQEMNESHARVTDAANAMERLRQEYEQAQEEFEDLLGEWQEASERYHLADSAYEQLKATLMLLDEEPL